MFRFGHSYGCVTFHHPATGVVDRLVQEIEMYKRRLEEIRKLT